MIWLNFENLSKRRLQNFNVILNSSKRYRDLLYLIFYTEENYAFKINSFDK